MELDELRLMVASHLYARMLHVGRTIPYKDVEERDARKEAAAVLALRDADVLIRIERETR